MGYPGAGHHLAASLLLMEGFALGLREEPLVLLDSEGRLEALNHAASMAIGVSPAEYLGREAASLPAPWGQRLSRPGATSRGITWDTSGDGWLALLQPLPLYDEELLWEAVVLAPSVGSALPLLAALYEKVTPSGPHALYVGVDGDLILVDGHEEAPALLTLQNSLALRLGRSVRFDGRLLSPCDGWPDDVPCVSRVLNLGSRVGIVCLSESDSPLTDAFIKRLQQSLLKFSLF